MATEFARPAPGFVSAVARICEKSAARLGRWSRLRFVATSVILAIFLSLLFFSPKFWVMTEPLPGTFEWARALTFLQQCQDPFSADVEPAMRWRLLPPLTAYVLGLRGYGALVLPYLGLLVLLAHWCTTVERFTADRLYALLATVLLATTGAVLTITGMYGINDAWFLTGLLAVAAGRNRVSLLLPGLLAPWVDERFLLGWPAALFCRWWLQGMPPRFAGQIVGATLALSPYVSLRIGYTLWAGDRGSGAFVADALGIVPVYLPYVRLGWWMGFRAAWILLLVGVYAWGRDGGRKALGAGLGITCAGVLAITLLAADLSRSTNLVLPLLLCGTVALHRLTCGSAHRYLWSGGLAIANLLIPYEAVIYNKLAPVWGLPLELLRLYKNAR